VWFIPEYSIFNCGLVVRLSWYVKEVFVKVGMQILGTDFRLISKRKITFLVQGII
jgi:hypothetical protein